MPFKTLESKETRAQGKKDGNAQFSLCCTSTKAGWRFQDRHPAFSYPRIGRAPDQALNNCAHDPVKRIRGIMRGFIIRDVSIEEIVAARRLQATEGYLELGMFEEAEEELRALDPAWFALEQTRSLQLRVFAGLSQIE